MRIFLDTSAIYSAGLRLQTGTLEQLKQFASREDVELITSVVVVDESANKFRQRLAEEAGKSTKGIRTINQLVKQTYERPFTDENITEWVKQYRDNIEGLFVETGGWILDYPKVSHETLVSRSIAAKKPFGGKTDGYRDAVIWHTLIEAIGKAMEDGVYVVHFCTANISDFAMKENGQYVLHPDLELDLVEAGFGLASVSLLTSLGDIIVGIIDLKLEELARVRDQMLSRKWKRGEFDTEVVAYVEEFLERRVVGDFIEGTDWEVDSVSEVAILEYIDISASVDEETSYYNVSVDVQCRFKAEPNPFDESFITEEWIRQHPSGGFEIDRSKVVDARATVSIVFDHNWTEVSVGVWSDMPEEIELIQAWSY